MRKFIILIILNAFFITNTLSQNPPSSAPRAEAYHGKDYSYSIAENNLSYALSCVFKNTKHEEIKTIILEEFPCFDGDILEINNDQYDLKIEIKNKGLKLELKSKNSNYLEERVKIINIEKKLIDSFS